MSQNQRYGMRSIDELLEDWMQNLERRSRETGEPLPEATEKGVADLRGKINKPSEAA